MEEDGKFLIQGFGGRRIIDGEIRVNGAKNDALPGLAAALLFRDGLRLSNVPALKDIDGMLELLSGLGVGWSRAKPREYQLVTTKLSAAKLKPEIAKRLRGSMLLTAPLLARLGEATFPHPGGCVIGARPIDIFLEGFQAMGVKLHKGEKIYRLRVPSGRLRGARIFLKNVSVTATEAFLLAGALAHGETVIENAALEPEVTHLAQFLRRAGLRVRGIGTTRLSVVGAKSLSGLDLNYRVIPDRIETGSFLILGALAAKRLVVRGVVPEHNRAVVEMLRRAGARLEVGRDSIVVQAPSAGQSYLPLEVKTHEFPGFPTDLQAPLTVLLTQAVGESTVFETIFEGRLLHLHTLREMGANVVVHDPHRATVVGPTPLRGRHVYSPDLRAGLAYILAAVVAEGESVVHNAHYVERGYERVAERLQTLGVKIVKE